jgi:hypothetical protein
VRLFFQTRSNQMECSIDSPRYWLANHVFVARTRHGAVILNLTRNKYLSVGPAESQALESLVEDWPPRTANSIKPPDLAVAEKELIDALMGRGIIRPGTHKTSSIPQFSVRLDGELVAIGDEIDALASVRIGHIVFFFYALIGSSLALRFRSIASLIENVRTRRAAGICNGHDFDWRRASEFVSIFRRIRPYVFIAGGNCLLHALTLVRFLAHYHQFPHLVLGVKVDPWGAHSWAQYGNFLLDTNPEKVCAFTPILAI